MKFKKLNLDEEVAYAGKIVQYAIDENKYFFRVYVEIEGLKAMTFMKCIRYAEFMPSALGDFCEEFGIVDRSGDVDFDDLLEIPVIVTLNKGRDGNFYVAQIEPTDGEDYEY